MTPRFQKGQLVVAINRYGAWHEANDVLVVQVVDPSWPTIYAEAKADDYIVQVKAGDRSYCGGFPASFFRPLREGDEIGTDSTGRLYLTKESPEPINLPEVGRTILYGGKRWPALVHAVHNGYLFVTATRDPDREPWILNFNIGYDWEYQDEA